MDDWANDGVQALKLRLVRSTSQASELNDGELVLVKDFSPAFVYPIFGTEETIFGYRNLEIQLHFASGSLTQYLHVGYDAKFPETSSVKADDPEQILYEFIPPSYKKELSDFQAAVENESVAFRPYGKQIGVYALKSQQNGHKSQLQKKGNGYGKGKGKAERKKALPEREWEILEVDGAHTEDYEEVTYVAFGSDWSTPGFQEYHRKMQIFVLLYIEGAQYIDEDDTRWEFVTLYERRRKGAVESFHFCGYVSFYTFFCWPDTKRIRLAQFVLLPPYQSKGHGSALYTLCYKHLLERPDISELTVEDPSERFEDMRDKCDLHTLLQSDALDEISAPIDRAQTELIRKRFKMADRQFYRLLEMVLLLKLDPAKEEEARTFRLLVKRRLYLFNKEMLAQIEPDERKVKLQETFEGVESDYKRISEKYA